MRRSGDVLVTAAQSVSRSAHLYVIAFGSVELGAAVQNSPVADIKPEMAMFDPVQVRRHQISLSTEMHTPDGLMSRWKGSSNKILSQYSMHLNANPR